MTESYHVHNAEMVQAEDWGATQTLLRFKGVSCGHGYGANEATIFMDKAALKKMIGIVELGESDSVLKEPPCRHRSVAQITRISTYKFEGGEWKPYAQFKDLRGSVPIEEPPCRFCEHWNPGKVTFGANVLCCTTDKSMWGDFSCYRPKEGPE